MAKWVTQHDQDLLVAQKRKLINLGTKAKMTHFSDYSSVLFWEYLEYNIYIYI